MRIEESPTFTTIHEIQKIKNTVFCAFSAKYLFECQFFYLEFPFFTSQFLLVYCISYRRNLVSVKGPLPFFVRFKYIFFLFWGFHCRLKKLQSFFRLSIVTLEASLIKTIFFFPFTDFSIRFS